MPETTTASVFMESLIYSCIAFSIVFIVLGGLTLVIYAMRILTGNSGGSSDKPSGGSVSETVKSAPAPKAEPAVSGVQAVGVKNHHVAAITAAILARTNGHGRILSITPPAGARVNSSETTSTWRTTAIIQSVERQIAPSWKR